MGHSGGDLSGWCSSYIYKGVNAQRVVSEAKYPVNKQEVNKCNQKNVISNMSCLVSVSLTCRETSQWEYSSILWGQCMLTTWKWTSETLHTSLQEFKGAQPSLRSLHAWHKSAMTSFLACALWHYIDYWPSFKAWFYQAYLHHVPGVMWLLDRL